MAGNKPIIYVDTCVFISMLTGEQRKGDESLHVAGFAGELERREVISVTSGLKPGQRYWNALSPNSSSMSWID